MYRVVGTDGQVYGPVDADTLRQWCREGRVLPATVIQDPISGQLVRADQLPETMAVLESMPKTQPMAPPMPTPSMGNTPTVHVNNYIGGHGLPAMPTTGPKSRVAAGLLALFLGAFGIHRFYLGHNGTGIAMLLLTVLTCGYGGVISGIWAIVDMIGIFTGSMRDSDGQPLY